MNWVKRDILMKTVLIYLLIILSPATSIMIYFSWVVTSMMKYQKFSLFTQKSKNITILESINFIYMFVSAQYRLYIYLIA